MRAGEVIAASRERRRARPSVDRTSRGDIAPSTAPARGRRLPSARPTGRRAGRSSSARRSTTLTRAWRRWSRSLASRSRSSSRVLARWCWCLVGRTLRPVEAIRAEVATIGGRDLDHRVPEPRRRRRDRPPGPHHERHARPARRRRPTAAAVRRRRLPRAAQPADPHADRARGRPRPSRTCRPLATHASVLDETIGLQRLVDDLLLVARADEGDLAACREPVDLDDIVLRGGPPPAGR